MLARGRSLEQSRLDEPFSHFVDANGTRSAANALEIVVWQPADGEGCIKHQASNPISTSDVVHAAFHLPTRQLSSDAFGDGLRIVIVAVLDHDYANAFCVVFWASPNALSVVFSNHDEEWGAVQPAKVSERPGGVSCTGADEALAAVVVHALDGRNGFHVFEAPRWAEAPLLRPVTMEGDPEVGKPHRFSQRISLVGHRAGDVVVGLRGRNPREVLPNTLCVLLELKRFAVHCAQQGVVRVVERVGVVDEVARF